MNIDVTAINPHYNGPGSNTWSEKLSDVCDVVFDVNGYLRVISLDFDGNERMEAVFAPGSWLSWRKAKD